MSVLVFPDNPVNGQLYPPTPIPGVNQYKWDSAANSWILFVGSEVWSILENKGDLIVGEANDVPGILPVGADGDTLVADSNEILGVKWATAPTSGIPESIIQAKGDLIVGQAPSTPDILPADTDGYVLTLDSVEPLGVKWAAPTSNPTTIQTVTYATDVLAPGATQEFWLDLGSLFAIVSIGVTTPPEDGWIRVYTSEAGMISDTRILPGPPFPPTSSGFAAEVVTTSLEPIVTLVPVPTFYSEDGAFFRFTNQSASTQSFTISLKVYTTIDSTCDTPPYFCNPYVSSGCVTNFSAAWSGCSSITSFPIIDVSSGTDFSSAWFNCTGLTSFPLLTFDSGTTFDSAWGDCSNLTSFPANAFDSCLATDFTYAWGGCSLDQTSVDNILVSLDTAGQSNGFINVDGGTSSAPGAAGLAAKASLEGKGWTVLVNTFVYIYCSPAYTTPPTDYPPYSCNTAVNTTGVTDFTSAWSSCYSIITFPCVDASSVTLFTDAWNNCQYMTTFPSINTSAGTDFSNAWASCYVLTNFPTLNLSSGTNFTYSWSYCYGLTTFPTVDMSSGSVLYGAWNSCAYLTTFPALDLSSGTDFTYTWYNCSSLTSFPVVDVSSGTDFYGAWWYCLGLTTFPVLNLSSGTDFYGAWKECSGLTTFPVLNLSSGLTFDFAWQYCSGLTSFPVIDMPSGTSFFGTWQYCSGLTSFPLIDVSAGTSFQAAWAGCAALTSFSALDTGAGTSFQGAWQGCTSLTTFSAIDTSSGTDFTGAWETCSSLTTFPALDFSSGLTFYNAWNGCSSLTSFPAGVFDTCPGTTFDYAWYVCALDQTSVDNILVSLDTAGQSNGNLGLNGGTSAAPSVIGLAAKASLQSKGWTVTTN